MNKDKDTKTNGDQDRSDSSGGIAARSQRAAENVKNAAVDQLEDAYGDVAAVKARAAERVRKLGAVIRKVGEHLGVEDQKRLANYASTTSDRIEGIASYIDGAEIRTLVRDSKRYASEKPALFFGSALLVGLAAGRFLRSSSSESPRTAPRRDGAPRQKTSGSDALA
ncbi:MAG TPA: hypothetical protein VGI70_09480 [Polyangiales bacterium]